jgi:hypothetical protein
MTVDFVLDEIDPTVSGIHMQDLISLWIEKGLSFEQFDTIYNVGVLTDSLDDKFVQSLMPPDTNFSRQMPFIISSLEFWDEIPAWHEVCLLKRAFESCEDSSMFAQSFDPLFKRCLIIITQLLPAEALGVSYNGHNFDLHPLTYFFISEKSVTRQFVTIPSS